MSDQANISKISELEKDVAVIKATIEPLFKKIDDSTSAMNSLAREIAMLVQSNKHIEKAFDSSRLDIKDNTNRIITLEKTSEVRRSSDAVMLWGKRAVVLAIVGAVMSLIIAKGAA